MEVKHYYIVFRSWDSQFEVVEAVPDISFRQTFICLRIIDLYQGHSFDFRNIAQPPFFGLKDFRQLVRNGKKISQEKFEMLFNLYKDEE